MEQQENRIKAYVNEGQMTMVKRFLSVQTSVQADEGQEQKFLLFEAVAIKKNQM